MKQLIILVFILVSGKIMAQPKIESNQLVLNGTITFKTSSDKLLPESDSALMEVKNFLDSKTFITLMRVEGHVASGTETANQSLSEKRALAIVKWLADKGIDSKRLIPVGFGSTKPVSNNVTENTRIVFALAALRGHLIGGMPADGGGKVAGTK